jgi:hypothetical protein
MKTNADTFQADFGGPQAYTTVALPVVPEAMDGLYKVEYLLNVAGSYNLALTLNGKHISGSPFNSFIALPGVVAPANSTSEGEGVETFIAGSPTSFTVQAKDAYTNDNDEDVGNVTAAVEWEHYLSSTTMPVFDDEALNNEEFWQILLRLVDLLGRWSIPSCVHSASRGAPQALRQN